MLIIVQNMNDFKLSSSPTEGMDSISIHETYKLL